MAPTIDRFKLARRTTGTRWVNVWGAQFAAAARARGKATAPDGTFVPRVTNREAMALIRAWRALAAMSSRPFSLWYQFAAIGYAWTVKRDTLAVNTGQSTKLYPVEATDEMWRALQQIALDLDDAQREDPSADLDPETFADSIWQAEVRKSLREDGAKADFVNGGWVIGFGGCKDPKTGKPRPPRAKCDVLQTPAGPVIKSCKLECDPAPIVIRDPFGMKPLFLVALILAAAWAYDNKRPLRRR